MYQHLLSTRLIPGAGAPATNPIVNGQWVNEPVGVGYWVINAASATSAILVDGNNAAQCAYTTDGQNYVIKAMPAGYYAAACHTGSRYVVTPNYGGNTARWSVNGDSWTGVSLGAGASWQGIDHDPVAGVTIAISDSVNASRSINGGTSFTPFTVPAGNWANIRADGAGNWLVTEAGSSNRWLLSTDGGESFNLITAPATAFWTRPAFGAGQWLVAQGYNVGGSDPSTSLAAGTNPAALALQVDVVAVRHWAATHYANGFFYISDVYAGEFTVRAADPAGNNWAADATATAQNYYALTSMGSTLIMSGANLFNGGSTVAQAYGLAAGNTTVFADAVQSYAAFQQVFSESPQSYAAFQVIVADAPQAYLALANVQAESPQAYGAAGTVSADAPQSYVAFQAVQADAGQSYVARQNVSADAAQAYLALENVSAVAAQSYVARQPVQADSAQAYTALVNVFADAPQTYDAASGNLSQVFADAPQSYSASGYVSADALQAYTAFQNVSADASQSYTASQTISADASQAYAANAFLSADAPQAYTARQTVQADAAQAYAALQFVGADSPQGYAANGFVEAAATQSYVARQNVFADRPQSYNAKIVDGYIVNDARAALLYHLALLHGLDPANPLTIPKADGIRQAGGLTQSITGSTVQTTATVPLIGNIDNWIDALAAEIGLTATVNVTPTGLTAGALTQTFEETASDIIVTRTA